MHVLFLIINHMMWHRKKETLNKMKRNVVIFLLTYCIAPVRNSELRDGYQNIVYGKRLDGYLIDIVVQISVLDCVEECLCRRRCLSINYNRVLLLCELNYKDITEELPSYQIGFIFSDISFWNVNLVGACGIKPCGLNEKCVQKEFGRHVCEIADCGLPAQIPLNSILHLLTTGKNIITFDGIGLGYQKTFSCRDGYISSGSGKTGCQSNGRWSDISLRCECPTEYTTYRSNTHAGCVLYKAENDDAETVCKNSGGSILRVDSNEKNDFFISFMHDQFQNNIDDKQIWLQGLKTESGWIYDDKTPILYENWYEKTENTGEIRYRACGEINFQWRDHYPNRKFSILCEISPSFHELVLVT